MKKFGVVVAAMILIACDAIMGEEIARIPINEVTTSDEEMVIKEATVDLKKGDEVGIWSDMDFEYEGGVALRFRVEIVRDGESLGGFEIDPTDKSISIGELKTTVQGRTDWSFTGKNSEYDVEQDGTYTFRAILAASENTTLKVNKAEIVLKK